MGYFLTQRPIGLKSGTIYPKFPEYFHIEFRSDKIFRAAKKTLSSFGIGDSVQNTDNPEINEKLSSEN
jgi:hypothetical protein